MPYTDRSDVSGKLISELKTLETDLTNAAMFPILQDNLTRKIALADIKKAFSRIEGDINFYTSSDVDKLISNINKELKSLYDNLSSMSNTVTGFDDKIVQVYNQFYKKLNDTFSYGTEIPTRLQEGCLYFQYFDESYDNIDKKCFVFRNVFTDTLLLDHENPTVIINVSDMFITKLTNNIHTHRLKFYYSYDGYITIDSSDNSSSAKNITVKEGDILNISIFSSKEMDDSCKIADGSVTVAENDVFEMDGIKTGRISFDFDYDGNIDVEDVLWISVKIESVDATGINVDDFTIKYIGQYLFFTYC